MEDTVNQYQSPMGDSTATTSPAHGRARLRPNQALPQLCALCGEPATMKRRMSFLGTTGELVRLNQWSSVGPTLMVPLCHRHRSFRRWWPAAGKVLLVLPLIIIVLAGLRPSIFALGLAAALAVADMCGLVWLIKRSLRIRATRIDNTHMVLVGLATAFAQACEDQERRHAERVKEALDGFQSPDST